MKKILFLGAARFQTPPVTYAKSKGYYVITCDNRPENPGHKLADGSYNVSTIDKEAVLGIAEKEKIDGIMSFGSDVSAPTAAYVVDKLNLPGNSPRSVETLYKKDLFRLLLNKSGIQTLPNKSFTENQPQAIKNYINEISFPAVIKPVDVSGSKGIAIVQDFQGIERKIQHALDASISKKIIVERFVAKKGPQICGDGWMENGKLKFVAYGDGHFYNKPGFAAPYGETFPSSHSHKVLAKVSEKLELILREANYQSGPFNLDVIIDENDEPFVIEIGPRNGGNYIPEAIKLNTGVDMTAGAVELALNANHQLPIPDGDNNKHYFACYMLHAMNKGKLKRIAISPEIAHHIYLRHDYCNPGDAVYPFEKANNAIGNVILKFELKEEMIKAFLSINDQFTIHLK